MKKNILIIIISLLVVSAVAIISYNLGLKNSPSAKEARPLDKKEVAKTELKQETKDMKDRKILMVIVQKFRDSEYSDVYNLLSRTGAKITVASLEAGLVKGADGQEVSVALASRDAKAADFDAVVFIGGPGMAEQTGNIELQKLAKDFFLAGKLTTAICIAPEMLAKAGILNGKQATVFPDGKQSLIAGGATYTGKPVTIDGSVVTADGPKSSAPFAEKIIDILKK